MSDERGQDTQKIEVPIAGADDVEPEIADAPVGVAESPLRARYRELQQEKHYIEVDVPGFNGMLVGRYVLIPEDRMKARRAMVMKAPKNEQDVLAAMDQLVEACDSLWERREDEKLYPLDPDDDAIRYDHRLGKALGFDAPEGTSARKVVRHVFTVNGVFNSAAMISHSQEVGIWMQTMDKEVDDAFVGESRAATKS